MREAVGEKVFNDPSKFCAFTLLSRGKWAFACCGSGGKPGHLYPNKGCPGRYDPSSVPSDAMSATAPRDQMVPKLRRGEQSCFGTS